MTYGTLKQDIAAYLYDRTDLVSAIPTFIRSAEDKIFRRLRIMENHTSMRYDVVGGVTRFAIPPDYMEVYTFNYNGWPLEKISAARYGDLAHQPGNSYSKAYGQPLYFARIAQDMRPYPIPSDGVFYFWYYSHLGIDQATGDRIDGDNDTNAVLTLAHDVYLHGALLEASAYLGQDSRIAVWKGLYDEGLNELEARESADNLSGDYIQVSNAY